MRFEARKNWQCAKLYLMVNGKKDGAAFAFDINKGYYERWVMDPKRPGKVMISGPIMKGKTRHLVKERLYVPFKVIWRDSGKPFRPWLDR